MVEGPLGSYRAKISTGEMTADPVQAQIFGMMPFIFVFIFAPFAAGLVLYWFWNTTLSILQQWLIMKKNGVSVDWGERFKLPGRKKTPAPGE